MKKIAVVLMMLLMVFGIGAIDISGSTSAEGMQGDNFQKIWLDQGAVLGIGPVGVEANFGYNIEKDVDENFWEYDFAAKYSIANFVFGSKIYGEKDLELRRNKTWVDFAYEDFSFNVSTYTLLDPEQEDWQGAEFSAFYKPGPFEFTAGYLMTDVGAELTEVAPAEPLDGGVYAKVKVNY